MQPANLQGQTIGRVLDRQQESGSKIEVGCSPASEFVPWDSQIGGSGEQKRANTAEPAGQGADKESGQTDGKLIINTLLA